MLVTGGRKADCEAFIMCFFIYIYIQTDRVID